MRYYEYMVFSLFFRTKQQFRTLLDDDKCKIIKYKKKKRDSRQLIKASQKSLLDNEEIMMARLVRHT